MTDAGKRKRKRSAKKRGAVATKRRHTAAQPKPASTRRVPRFAGVSTLLRLPQRETPDDLDVMLCGAPFDGASTYRPGSRFGPRAVREASALSRGFHPTQGLDLFERLRCADGGDIPCVPMSVERSLDAIRSRVAEIAGAGVMPVLVGGDHTVSLGALRALAARGGPLGLVHFDAHSDTFSPAWGIDLHHGTVFRHAVEEGLLREGDVLQIGIRGPYTAAGDLDFAREHGFHIVSVDDVRDNLAGVERRLARLARRGRFYVSVDVDALDPAYAPGTGTPVPGGLTSWELFRCLRALSKLEIAGADVVEVSPEHDRGGTTALVAVHVLTELLASVAAGRKKRREKKYRS